MTNPFRLRWLQGWTFQIEFMEGKTQIEAHGFGICLRSALLTGESPKAAADRLVLAEDQRRRALHSAWSRGNELPAPAKMSVPLLSNAISEEADSLVVVRQDCPVAV